MFRISISGSLPLPTIATEPSAFRPSSSPSISSYPHPSRRRIVAMAAIDVKGSVAFVESMVVKPPSHPTYDLKTVIALAFAEDAGDRGDVTSVATIPSGKVVEAHFIAKEDGVIAGIALAEMIFDQVDPSLQVEFSVLDGSYIRKGMQFGKLYGSGNEEDTREGA